MGLIIDNCKYTERQGHALYYEEYIIEKYNLIKESKYHSEWNAYTLGEEPTQIKVREEIRELHLSDLNRNANKDKDFYIIEGIWRYNRNKEKEVIEENIYKIPIDFWKNQFPKREVELMKKCFDNVDNTKETDKVWNENMKKYRKIWNETGSIVSVRFKRDNIRQKRVQCAISIKNMEHLERFKISSIKID